MKNPVPKILTSSKGFVRRNLFAAGFFSFFVNILMLSGPLYMLQVYDRVLPSGSVETLIALSVLLLGLFVLSGFLDFVRSRVLARTGEGLENRLAGPVFDAAIRKRTVHVSDEGDQSLTDLETVKEFMSGNGLPAFFDLPWVPVYMILLAILHPLLGMLGVGGALLLATIAWINSLSTRRSIARYASAAAPARAIAAASQQQAHVLRAMSMESNLKLAWMNVKREANLHQKRSSDRSGLFSITSKTLRMILQSAALGLGAALVIGGQITAGAMIAGTIILGRGLAPVDQSIVQWRAYLSARAAWDRIEHLLQSFPEPKERLSQAKLHKSVSVEHVYAAPPGAQKAVISEVNFMLGAGEVLAVIGPSASGKSTLARLLAGIWVPQSGAVRLDGATFEQWNAEEIGPQIGYLPQDVQLFDGTIAENIARFTPNAQAEEIISAASAAGLHETILQLPNGYETAVGEGGHSLSGGQRQRIGLARALFGDPFLVVLDEPNASLDADGDVALSNALQSIRARKGIAIVISHRNNIVKSVDNVLILENGRQRAFGPKETVLANNVQHIHGGNANPNQARPAVAARPATA